VAHPDQETVMPYRIDATIQGPHGEIKVMATYAFEAKTLAQAQEIADQWAARHEVSEACTLRLVQNEIILSQRSVLVAGWPRSGGRSPRHNRAGSV
jgi:hypothetical protein